MARISKIQAKKIKEYRQNESTSEKTLVFMVELLRRFFLPLPLTLFWFCSSQFLFSFNNLLFLLTDNFWKTQADIFLLANIYFLFSFLFSTFFVVFFFCFFPYFAWWVVIMLPKFFALNYFLYLWTVCLCISYLSICYKTNSIKRKTNLGNFNHLKHCKTYIWDKRIWWR